MYFLLSDEIITLDRKTRKFVCDLFNWQPKLYISTKKKKSAIPLSMNALATPSEPKNPSNIKSSFDTALFFYSMMYWDNDLEIVNNKSDLSVVLDYVLCITAAQGWCSLREEVGMFCHCFYFLF